MHQAHTCKRPTAHANSDVPFEYQLAACNQYWLHAACRLLHATLQCPVAHLTPIVTALLVANAMASQHKLAAITKEMAMVTSHQPKLRRATKLAYEPYDSLPGLPASQKPGSCVWSLRAKPGIERAAKGLYMAGWLFAGPGPMDVSVQHFLVGPAQPHAQVAGSSKLCQTSASPQDVCGRRAENW